MEKIGLVTKEADPRDARVSLVKFTDAGKNLYRDSEKSLNQVAESLTRPLSDKQRDMFLTLEDRLL